MKVGGLLYRICSRLYMVALVRPSATFAVHALPLVIIAVDLCARRSCSVPFRPVVGCRRHTVEH